MQIFRARKLVTRAFSSAPETQSGVTTDRQRDTPKMYYVRERSFFGKATEVAINFCKISRFLHKKCFFYNVHQYDGTRSDPGVLDAKSTLRSVTYRRSSEFPVRALFHLPQTRPSQLEILGDFLVNKGGGV